MATSECPNSVLRRIANFHIRSTGTFAWSESVALKSWVYLKSDFSPFLNAWEFQSHKKCSRFWFVAYDRQFSGPASSGRIPYRGVFDFGIVNLTVWCSRISMLILNSETSGARHWWRGGVLLCWGCGVLYGSDDTCIDIKCAYSYELLLRIFVYRHLIKLMINIKSIDLLCNTVSILSLPSESIHLLQAHRKLGIENIN